MADLAALNDGREFLSRCEAECKALVGFGRLANVLGLFRAAGIRYGAIVFDLPRRKGAVFEHRRTVHNRRIGKRAIRKMNHSALLHLNIGTFSV